MNKAVYRHLLQSFGRRPGVWIGLAAEVISGLFIRVWLVIVMAQVASDLAGGDIQSAKYNVFLFAVVYVVGSIIKTAGELIAGYT